MDKETIALVEDVRKSLVEFGKKQSTSAKKKTRKITSQIIWEPGPYLDQLDNILSTSKTKDEAVKKIRSLVRKSEEDALKTMNLLPDDTMHHIVQSRTGGDALTDISYERTGPIIEGLSEKHQMTFGNTTGPNSNLPAESSLSNYSHKADDKATGLERQSDIGVNPDKTSTAHPGHTAEHAHMKGVDMSSDKAITEALDYKVTKQVESAQTAFKTDAPRQNAIKELVPGAYAGTADDVADARKLIQPQLLTNRNAILNAYRALTKVPGGRAALGLIPGGIGFGLNALGAVSDANAVAESTTTPRTDDMKQTSRDLGGLGGVAGLLSLFSPHAVPAAIGLAGAQLAVDNRIARDKDRELDVQQMDPATRTNSWQDIDATITPTAPKNRIRGRSGAQKAQQGS